ncbi:Wzz/FepE/Etk N-terminal domain-containing protein [Sphingorhabdus sp.]|jgi:capsular polysaccharide transport system permease protein|uniref:Wzz/FepE/Etk N-terminal domain-containing protein n=1 Tax=Sphingorhabdus sp. TaxID=1902408 RepID=UPI0037C98D9C
MMDFSRLREKIVKNRWFLIAVVLPSLASACYFSLFASDQYVSESRFVIKAPNQRSGQISSFANLIQTTGLSAGQEQANEVIDFVRSRSALETLVKKISVNAIYSDPEVDFLTRYPLPWQSRSFEDLFKFYKSKVQIERDNDTGLVVLRTIAFDPAEAALVNENLLRASERLVNQLNETARSRAISESERRVTEAERRVASARLAVANYRNASELVDPLVEASGVIGVANALIAERASLEAQLSTLQRLTPQHPSIPALRAQIASLDQAIRRQTARMVGGKTSIAGKLPAYDSLVLEQELSSELLVLAQTTLEGARTEALKQQFYLERVVNPNIPDSAAYPRGLRIVLTIIGFLLCLYFIIWMFLVGILEHAPED